MSQPPVTPPEPPPFGTPYGGPSGPPSGSPYGSPAPYGAPSPYGAPGYRPPASSTMAKWSLALALLICIPFGFLVSIGLAITVLVKSRDGRDHGKSLAVAALVIATLWFIVQAALVAFGVYKGITEGIDAPRDGQGNVTESTEVTIGNLRVGDCFDDPALLGATEAAGEGVTAQAMPCTDPHTFEVFHVFEIPGDDYPGTDKVYSLADEGCAREVRSFLGGRPERGSNLAVYLYYPQKRTWSLLGDHKVQCVIGRAEPKLISSLRGTGN